MERKEGERQIAIENKGREIAKLLDGFTPYEIEEILGVMKTQIEISPVSTRHIEAYSTALQPSDGRVAFGY